MKTKDNKFNLQLVDDIHLQNLNNDRRQNGNYLINRVCDLFGDAIEIKKHPFEIDPVYTYRFDGLDEWVQFDGTEIQTFTGKYWITIKVTELNNVE